MKEIVNFFGSKDDLDALQNALVASEFKKNDKIFLKASYDVIPASISFVMGTGIGSCIKHFLIVRGKRMVTRETHGEKIVIKGDFSVDEIERLLKIPHAFDIEDDAEPAANPNRESEMGFHVGMKKEKGK
jgi:hypothetical protein